MQHRYLLEEDDEDISERIATNTGARSNKKFPPVTHLSSLFNLYLGSSIIVP